MRPWRAFLIRGIGCLNILVGLAGLIFVLPAAVRMVGGSVSHPPSAYFLHRVFPWMATIAVVWFLLSILSGVYLWGLRRLGYRLAASLYIFEIVYSLALGSIPVFFKGQQSLQVQISVLTAFVYLKGWVSLLYAIFGFVALKVLVWKKYSTSKSQRETQTSRDHRGPGNAHLRAWIPNLIRVFGGLNILFGVTGMFVVVLDFVHHAAGAAPLNRPHYGVHAFYAGLSIDLVFLALLVLAGCFLIRSERRGIVLSNYVLVSELVYWLGISLISFELVRSDNNAAVLVGRTIDAVSNLGTVLQIGTGYPFVALVVLNLACRHVDRHNGWKTRGARAKSLSGGQPYATF